MKVYTIDTEEYNFLDFGDIQKAKVLWLDDEREPMFWLGQFSSTVEVTWAKNSAEFMNAIKNGKFKQYHMICMDHDLGNDSANGSDCAWLLKEAIEHEADFGELRTIFIHSDNLKGKKNMYGILHVLETWYKKLKELEK